MASITSAHVKPRGNEFGEVLDGEVSSNEKVEADDEDTRKERTGGELHQGGGKKLCCGQAVGLIT